MKNRMTSMMNASLAAYFVRKNHFEIAFVLVHNIWTWIKLIHLRNLLMRLLMKRSLLKTMDTVYNILLCMTTTNLFDERSDNLHSYKRASRQFLELLIWSNSITILMNFILLSVDYSYKHDFVSKTFLFSYKFQSYNGAGYW